PGSSALRALSIAGTGVIPPGGLAWGPAARRPGLVGTGIALAAPSLVTLRPYLPLGPARGGPDPAGAGPAPPAPPPHAAASAARGDRGLHRGSTLLGRAAPAGAPGRAGRRDVHAGGGRSDRGWGRGRRRNVRRRRRDREVLKRISLFMALFMASLHYGRTG